MENEKTRYDVLLAQLDYIKNGGKDKLFNPDDGNNDWINQITTKLAEVCEKVDFICPCSEGFHREDGMCVPD